MIQKYSPHSHPFGKLSIGENLFMVQPGISREVALHQATNMFDCAADLMTEAEDADLQLSRKLTRTALHFIDAGRALVEVAAETA